MQVHFLKIIRMVSRTFRRRLQRFVVIIVVVIFLSFLSSKGIEKRHHKYVQIFRPPLPETWYEGVIFEASEIKGQRKDWHDYIGMVADSYRVGPGENGSAVFNIDNSKKELEKQMSLKNGFNALVSDLISVNRSVPDVRHKICRSKQYLANLPTISVIIPCLDEYESVLKRTLHSIYNRSPRSLLKEIIIVDDSSEFGYSIDKMILYVKEQFPDLVKFIRLPERRGLIYARQRGAKEAIGDVLVFFDSHIECNYNWLPPLLEPIAIDDRISTSPIIDTINHASFEYSGGPTPYARGGFNWELRYMYLSVKHHTDIDGSKPYKDLIMLGGLFAISRRFFWELGGYDDKLDIWGSEQFEISFKIWMCGGMLLVTPCSHVAHIFRGPRNKKPARNYNFLATNNKRVAEVWMDEYKYYIYEDEPEMFANLTVGDLTERYALRKRLKCKSFKWYLEVIAPDVLKKYPPNRPPDYANGALQSVAYKNFCLDTLQGRHGSYVGVFQCAKNLLKPQRPQYWHLTWRNEIENHRSDLCLDQYESLPNGKVHVMNCHTNGGNQFWTYNKKHKWVQHRKDGRNCLEILKNKNKFSVVVNRCNKNNERMRWNFAYVNNTAFALKNVDS